MIDVSGLVVFLDLLGTFIFGLSGATLAVRRQLDVFGVLVLATAASLAGGVLRDLLLGATPPPALIDPRYLSVALGAGLLAFLALPLLNRLDRPVMVLDALGLGLFAVTGCRKALEHGLEPVACLLLGVLTGIGGGVLRDLLVSETPRVLREEIYAVAALVGAAIVIAGDRLGLAEEPVMIAGVVSAVVMRVVSVARGWSAPRSPWS